LRVAAAALVATGIAGIVVMLSGSDSEIAAQVLSTVASIAGASLLGVPGAVLFDRGRVSLLARATTTLAGAVLVCLLVLIWIDTESEGLWKTLAVLLAASLAATQTSALVASVRGPETRTLRRLFTLATVLVCLVAVMGALGAVFEVGGDVYWRIFGALAVSDIVVVLLRPIMRRMAPATAASTHPLRIVTEPGGEREVEAEGRDLADAISDEVRKAEREGTRVVRIEPLG
jgi:hypothetical protein